MAIRCLLDRFVPYLALAAMVGSLLVLVPGWMMGIDRLVRLVPGLPAMVPSTASLFLLASAGMLGWLFLPGGRAGAMAIRYAAIVIFASAACSLALKATGIAPGIDQLVWPGHPLLASESMSPATGLSFLLLAVAMYRVTAHVRRDWIFTISATVNLSLAILALLVYYFHAGALFTIWVFSTMAVPTAAGFAVTTIAVLLLRMDRGWVAILLADGPASAAARRTLPAMLGITLALALVAGHGIRALDFPPNFALCLLATGTMATLVTVVVRDARYGNWMAGERIAALTRLEAARALEAELRLERDRAAASAAAKSNFLANMSHELRTAMNGVLGFTELLLEGKLDPSQRRYAELIAESGQSMIKLINEILDVSKIEAGHMAVAEETIDIRQAVRSSVRLMHPAAMQKDLTLDLLIDSDCPTFVLGDSLRIKQVLTNLIGNAIKFTDKGRIDVLLRIAVHNDGPQIELTVSDTGVGIPRDRHEAIFENFQQAENGDERNYGGTGLGLTISRKLVKLMGGKLILSSDEGAGTMVIVRLPLKFAEPSGRQQGKAIAPRDRPREASLRNRQYRRVLIAEDHDINQMLTEAMLVQLGCVVAIADDGVLAVHMVEEAIDRGEPFDLVLMDIQMPFMDGIEAARAIRKRGISADELPVVALTADAYAADIERCLAAGMQDHVAKPITKDDLAAVLDRWIARRGRTGIRAA